NLISFRIRPLRASIGVEARLGTASAAMLMPKLKRSLPVMKPSAIASHSDFPAEALGREMQFPAEHVGNFPQELESKRNIDDETDDFAAELDFLPDFSRMAGNGARGRPLGDRTETPRVGYRATLG